MKDDAGNHIFTEDLDYSQTDDTSIWGNGDPETITLLKRLISKKKIVGDWLNFAAGDGRYNTILLSSVDSLIATDIDSNALKKLMRVTPKSLLKKVTTTEQNITKQFQFSSQTFDGVFNTGTLHLFPVTILESIFSEVARVLKSGGLFIFDFATDVKRIKPDGTIVGRSGVDYTMGEARKVLVEILTENKFQFELIDCVVPPEEVTSGDGTYTFSCNFLLVVASRL